MVLTLKSAFSHSRLVTGFCLDADIPCQTLSVPAVPYFLRLIVLIKRFEDFFSDEKEMVFYSGNYAPLAVNNLSHCMNIFYCHTPPRFLYDKREFYSTMVPAVMRPAYRYFCLWYRQKYERAVKSMDLVIANSENVKRRLRKYLRIDSVVVYPPVDTKGFGWKGQGDFFLSTGRVDPLKRIDLIVKTFLGMPDYKLRVVSSGPDLSRIKKIASGAQNIEILGWVSNQELKDLMGSCRASVYIPRNEDFGISPVESMAAGKPVIGVAEGGLLETIRENETGILLPAEPVQDDLIRAVLQMDAVKAAAMRNACEKRAKGFDTEVFLDNIGKITGHLVKSSSNNRDL